MATYTINPPASLGPGWHTPAVEQGSAAIYSAIVNTTTGTVSLLRNGKPSDKPFRVGVYTDDDDKPGSLLLDCGMVTGPTTLPELAAVLAANPAAWCALIVDGLGFMQVNRVNRIDG